MMEDADTRIKQLHEKAKILFNEDLDETEIIEALQKDGIDAAYTKLIIENIRTDIRDRADFWKLIFMGSFFIAGGVFC